MEVLLARENETFTLNKKFEFKSLSPIAKFVQSKLENNLWDDYNELYHAMQLIESLKKDQNVWLDTHTILKNDAVTGVLLIIGGQIGRLERKYEIDNEEQSLLLKYFHIVEKGKGLGSFWIKSIILPYYLKKGFRQIYVNSSHPDSFAFYQKLGSLIASYTQMSDNKCYKREGACFLINF